MWAGIHRAMEVLRTNEMQGQRKKAILLLTDGVPSFHPPGGYVESLRNYMD